MWQWLMFVAVLLIGVRTDLAAQTRPVAVVGGMLIDGTGRPALEDAVVVFSGGRIQEVGKRGEVTIPRGAQVIDAKGKTILPGLIDGHCHYWEWLGELYLAYGVTTCPDINNSPTEWIIAQKDGIQKGKIRGPRLWISGHALDGPRPQGMPEQRWQRGSIIVRTDEEARQAVRDHVAKGMDGFKVLERVSPEVAKAIADEARKLGKPVIGHSVNMWETIDAGYTSIEHSWAVMFTTIKDPKKRAEVDMNRMVGKVGTVEAHVNMVPEQFDEIIKAMIAKDIHWSPAWATQFRALSPRAAEMKKRELATLEDSQPSLFAGVQSGSGGGLLRRLRKDDAGTARAVGSGLQNGPGLCPPLRRRRRQDPFRIGSGHALAGVWPARRARTRQSTPA